MLPGEGAARYIPPSYSDVPSILEVVAIFNPYNHTQLCLVTIPIFVDLFCLVVNREGPTCVHDHYKFSVLMSLRSRDNVYATMH